MTFQAMRWLNVKDLKNSYIRSICACFLLSNLKFTRFLGYLVISWYVPKCSKNAQQQFRVWPAYKWLKLIGANPVFPLRLLKTIWPIAIMQKVDNNEFDVQGIKIFVFVELPLNFLLGFLIARDSRDPCSCYIGRDSTTNYFPCLK